jgi:hypothetical protein
MADPWLSGVCCTNRGNGPAPPDVLYGSQEEEEEEEEEEPTLIAATALSVYRLLGGYVRNEGSNSSDALSHAGAGDHRREAARIEQSYWAPHRADTLRAPGPPEITPPEDFLAKAPAPGRRRVGLSTEGYLMQADREAKQEELDVVARRRAVEAPRLAPQQAESAGGTAPRATMSGDSEMYLSESDDGFAHPSPSAQAPGVAGTPAAGAVTAASASVDAGAPAAAAVPTPGPPPPPAKLNVYEAPGRNGGPPPFEFVESIVVDEATGARLSHEKVVGGSTRLETLCFKVRGRLTNLKRTTTTAKSFGFAGFQNVAKEVLELGSYDEPMAGDAAVQRFEMPASKIPNSVFAMGRYRTKVHYYCDEVAKLRVEDIELSVVPAGS